MLRAGAAAAARAHTAHSGRGAALGMSRAASRTLFTGTRAKRAPIEPYVMETLRHTRSGFYTNYSSRQRFRVWSFAPCNVMNDFIYGRVYAPWFQDLSFYYQLNLMAAAVAVGFFIALRYWFCSPEVGWRKMEKRLPPPDRHRSFAYANPFFNTRVRSIATGYTWMLCDNEPDWGKRSVGYREDRAHVDRRPRFWSPYHCVTYKHPVLDDPMLTTLSHDNMAKFYDKIGYKKAASHGEEEEEED